MSKVNRRDFIASMGSAAAGIILSAGCSREKPSKSTGEFSGPARHVIFVSLDTARPDHFGCYGNEWIKTPRIDALAAESILFANFMTVAPTTLASHTSLLTGKYPHNHGVPRNGFMVNRENLMLTEILKSTGFHTAGFLGSFALDSRFDFAQGFDHYDENFNRFVGVDGVQQNERSADCVTDAAIKYLDSKSLPPNLFLFVHYFDPHQPYTPPQNYNDGAINSDSFNEWIVRRSSRRNRKVDKKRALMYANEVTHMDKHLGRLIDYLDKRGILDEAITVVTSDHGENFWEHEKNWNHGFTVYQTTMDALCIIRLPGKDKAGTRVDGLFSNIDVLPTLLDYMGLDVPDGIDGEGIDLSAGNIAIPERIRFGQATKPYKDVETDPRWRNILKARCVRDGNLKFMQTPHRGTEELYDLSKDPLEQKNLLKNPIQQIKEKSSKLRKTLEEWANSVNPLPSVYEPIHKEETLQRLNSLGYIE